MIRQKLPEVVDEFTKAGYMVTIHPTQNRMDAAVAAEYACLTHYDKLVCCGGDGTLSEVIQGVLLSEEPIPIGYIPTGSTNDFAKSLEIPSDPIKAVDVCINGTPYVCDIGKMNQRYFTYIAAFGAFMQVPYETPQSVKNQIGHAAYLLNSVRYLNTLRGYYMKLEYDGNVIEGDFLLGMVSNTASIAGMIRMNSFDLSDGLFEVILIRKPENIAHLQKIIDSLIHLNTRVDERYVLTFRASSLRFTMEQGTPWTIDGEKGESNGVIQIDNIKKALSFYTYKK